MDLFGAGNLWATPSQDATGAAVSNPTPILVGILQEMTLDVSSDIKELYGQLQDAIDIGRAKRKITGKLKNAKITAALWDTVIFGTGLTAGLLGVVGATTPATIPGTPYQITPTVPSSGTWDHDLGVIGPTGVEYTRVASAPATGQYSVAAGVYTFAAADTAKGVFINFAYTASVTGAFKKDIPSLPMGSAPTFQVDFGIARAGKTLVIKLPKCVSGKASFAFKNEDFTIPEIDFQAFVDPATNSPISLSWSE